MSIRRNVIYCYPCLVEAVPEIYELLKYRNRNASTLMTCLAVEKRPHVSFVSKSEAFQ